MEKYDLLPKQLMQKELVMKMIFSPHIIDENVVKIIHHKDYVNRLKRMDLSKSELRKIGFPISQQLVKREFIIAGGTLEGALKSLKEGISLILPRDTSRFFNPR